MKRFIFKGADSLWLAAIIAITAMAFTACVQKSETQTAVAVAAENYARTQTANPHPEILNGDLSNFAGMWINNDKDSATLSSGGVFDPGGWGNGLRASDFKNSGEGVNEIYSWVNLIDGDGFSVTLYPAGTEVAHYDGNILQTDITRTRIAIGNVFSSDDVYYFSLAGYSEPYADPYVKILSGDLYAFAGTWVDGYGFSGQLRSDGIFDRGGETVAYGFEKNNDGTYSWYVSWGGESMGSYLTLFPPGVEVIDNSYPQQLLITDITKVRIADTAKGIGSSKEVFYRQGEAQAALEYEELRAGSSVKGVVGRDWIERYNIRSVDSFYISLVIESEVEILLDVYNGQRFITSSINDSGEYHSRIEIAAQPNTVYLLEAQSYVRDVTEAAFRITAHLSQ